MVMVRKLKNLKVEFISLISKKARPINQHSKLTFVKSEKEEKDMTFEEFMKAATAMFGSKAPVEAPAIETVKAEVIPAPDFVTKAEIETQFNDINTKIDKLTELLTTSTVEKSTSNEKIGEFITGFSEAYRQDREALKAEITEEIAKAKRATSPVVDQVSLQEIVQKAMNPISALGLNKESGHAIQEIINKGIGEGRMKQIAPPNLYNSSLDAIRKLQGCTGV
jgi:chorismate mutase